MEKGPEPNAVYILSELEKHVEDQNSFLGRYKDIDELVKFRESSFTDSSPKFIQNQNSHSFLEFKVINSFKVKEPDSGDTKYRNNMVVLLRNIA